MVPAATPNLLVLLHLACLWMTILLPFQTRRFQFQGVSGDLE
jgi:hypothetical protein